MNRRLFGMLGTLAALTLVSCKEDPLAGSAGSLEDVDLQFTYLEVVIGDSARTFAVERDALNTPLPPTATVRSCDPSVATVTAVSDAPQQRTGFYVKGLTYGSTCVIAEARNTADTMQVATFPATIVITSGPDTILSGSVAAFTFEYRDRAGNPVAGVPAPTFSSSDTTKAKSLASPLGSVRGRAPGFATITVTGTGAPAGGSTATKQVVVVPGSFTGGISATSGSPGDTVILTNASGGPGFDADTRVTINDVETFTFGVTADSLRFVVPGVGVAGLVPLELTGMGPDQAAQNTTFTSNTASLADPYDGTNDDPSTAPSITANGDYFVILSGTCTDGVVTDPGDDCDDFFRVANPSGTDTLFAEVALDWFSGSDADILWCRNSGCTSVTTGGGATTANPEVSIVKIPPGATWFLWINYFEPVDVTKDILRVGFSGFP